MTRRCLVVAWLALSTVAIVPHVAGAQERTSGPLAVDSLLDTQALVFPTMSALALSSDGRFVAYVTRQPFAEAYPSRVARGQESFTATGMRIAATRGVLYVTEVATRVTRRITELGSSAYAPAWSPDSQRLAFYYDKGGSATVWTWHARNGELRESAPARGRPLDSMRLLWTPDSNSIVALLEPEAAIAQPASKTETRVEGMKAQFVKPGENLTVKVYSFDPSVTRPTGAAGTARPALAVDVAVLTPDTREVRRIANSIGPRAVWLSPDGATVALAIPVGDDGGQTYRPLYDVVAVSVKDALQRTVASRIRLSTIALNISWSPDSKALAYITTDVGYAPAEQTADGQAYVVSADGSGEPQRVTRTKHPHLGNTYRPPAWSRDGSRLYAADATTLWEINLVERTARRAGSVPGKALVQILTPATGGRVWSHDGGDSVVVLTRDGASKEEGFYAIDVATGTSTRLWEGPQHFADRGIMHCDTSELTRSAVCVSQSFATGPNVWSLAGSPIQFRPVSQLNPELDSHQLGSNQVIEWRDPDGYVVKGTLALPPNYQPASRYPLLVTSYPGRTCSDSVNEFGGRSVVDLIQLFTTRGYAVLCADVPLRRRGLARDISCAVLSGVDKVVAMGVADPDRIGVLGESAGGYAVLALITQTHRFKAAVSMSGFADLMGLYGSFREGGEHWGVSWSERGDFLGGTPWEVRERFIENSPIFVLDRVQTPLLMLHGAADVSVGPHLAGQVFMGLRRLGRRVVYAEYGGEQHDIITRDNRRDLLERVLSWFNEHVLPTVGNASRQ